MYASIRRAKGKPGSIAEAIQKTEQGFLPILSQVPGFVAYYLVDLGDDTVATVSIFQDKAGAEESSRRAQDWVKGSLAPLMAGPLEIIGVGEVVVQKTG